MASVVPGYLHERLLAEYGPLTETIEAGFDVRRPVTLRINTLRSGAEEVCAALEDAGIRFERVKWYPDALVMPECEEKDVQALPIYMEGKVYLQGLSPMLPPLMMRLVPGESVLDMAAAPGGKTTQMAALSGDRVMITACERDAPRAERLRFNLARQWARRVQVLQQDARNLDPAFRFDSVLLDAPCSGSGTLLLSGPQRRLEPDWLAKVVKRQKAMLRKGLSLLRAGGELVYATCSILREENEEVLREAVESGAAELLPPPEELAACLPLLPTALPGVLCVCPTENFEGFFAAKIRKRA